MLKTMNSSERYSRFRWMILLQNVIITICATVLMISFAPLMGVIGENLKLSIGTATFGFMGLYMLAMAVGCAFSGYLLDRFGVFPVLNYSLIVIFVSNSLLPLLGHSYWPVVAIRVMLALGSAPVFVAIGPAVALWFPPREAATALGVQSVAISTGIMSGLIVSPLLVQSTGVWQNGIAWLSAGVAVAMLPVVAISIAAGKHSPAVQPDEPTSASAPSSISSLVKTRPFLAGILGISCGIWTQQAFNSLAPGYLAVASPVGLGVGAVGAGKLMTTVLLAGIVASILGGILVDKVCGGRVRPVVLTGFILLIASPISLLVPEIFNQRSALILCLMLAGTATPFINPVILGFAAKTFRPSVVGRVVGSWMSVGLFSGAAGVMVGSGALEATGSYRLPMEILSAIAATGLVAALFIYPAKANSTAEFEPTA